MKKRRIKVNKEIPGYAAGRLVEISVDNDGVPLDRFWRDRVRDAEIDSCVEFMSQKTLTNKKTSKGDNQ